MEEEFPTVPRGACIDDEDDDDGGDVAGNQPT